MMMSDEKFEFLSDCKEKKITAQSARNRRGMTGKGGKVRMPSDSLTKKQLNSLHGECKTYRLGSPMSWSEFSEMPDDLKKMYIKKLRTQYGVPDEELALAMDVGYSEFADCLRAIKLSPKVLGENRDWYATDDAGRFRAWWVLEEK
jgi:hypothetical protein